MSIAFVDIETTGLDPAKHAVWEVSILTDDDHQAHGNGVPWTIHIPLTDEQVAAADPVALKINGFEARYLKDIGSGVDPHLVAVMNDPAGAICRMLADKTVIGSNPTFDTRFLSVMFEKAGLVTEPWLYRSVDVATLAAGVLMGRGEQVPVPFSSGDLGEALGVTRTGAHTAEGDVLWAKAIWDACHEDRPGAAATVLAETVAEMAAGLADDGMTLDEFALLMSGMEPQRAN